MADNQEGTPKRTRDLLSGALLRRNVVLNLATLGTPLVAALFAIPRLLTNLGEERFGFLVLAWALVHYSGLLDVGLGRALSKVVAERWATRRREELDPIISSSLALLAGLGLLGGGLLLWLAPALVGLLGIDPELEQECAAAAAVLGLAVPATILSAGLRGILEALQRFGRISAVRIPVSLLLFLAPVVAMQIQPTLTAGVAALVLSRWIGLWGFWVQVRRSVRWQWSFGWPAARLVLRLGGWMSVSNLIAPLLLYLDRFVVAATLSLRAVSYYATPFEIVNRLAIFPAALMGVLFPAFSTALSSSPKRAVALYRRSLALTGLVLVPLSLVAILIAPLGLSLWLGDSFAARATRPAQILAVGVVLHGFAQPSFHLLQAAGRPDLTAKLHLLEAPFYAAYLLWLTSRFGINGTAAAWSVRVGLSCMALTWLAKRTLPDLESPS